ncbi:Chs5-Arf1p-binding protein BUD7/BCH1, partial [Lecanoromycetidae sp. Uapishka_2]
MVVPAVPEIIEEDIESAVESRNEALQTIRELGPPDLVHLIKQAKSGGRQSGVYHHVTGVDASSSASLAAYVNTLVYSPNDKTHKVVSGLYCCYNAFSHVDMRVEVKIPGGVESYYIDERGDKRVAPEGLWLETFLCAVLRAYSYADDGSGDSIKKIIGVRRFDPITSTEVEHKFLDAAEKLFFKAAPSEFGTWAKLAEIYVGLEQWDLALLTLNSCPMFTYQDKDAPRMPDPARIMLPVLAESMLDEIDEGSQGYDSELVHPSLRKLHAAGYKGTFLKAYSLLTEITAKIGWDQLLKIRSQVFVMEEEYRSEKQTGGNQEPTQSQNASTVALHSPSPRVNGATPTPTSAEEEDDREDGASTATTAVTAQSNGAPSSATLAADDSIEKPNHTITSEEVKAGNEDPSPSASNYTQFHNKRLCERWLDNLFMVLYEDLRIYTIWRTDMARARSDESTGEYRKSAEEWEILGELAERLHHFPEAVEAYQSCLRVRFSPKAMTGVLRAYEAQGKVGEVLQAVIRLVAWQYRWYSEFSPALLRTVRKLIESEGAMKVRSIVQASSLPQPVLDLTHRYVELCASFRSNGSDG